MPFYFDTVRATTTNGTTLTESPHLLGLTAANQRVASLRGLYGTARSGTAGGASLRVKTAGTAGTGGTSQTPAKRESGQPAAGLVVTNDATTITPGMTLTVRLAVGLAQTGGNGGWVALEPAAALSLMPNAGANGNMEIYSIAVGTSVPIDVTMEHAEG